MEVKKKKAEDGLRFKSQTESVSIATTPLTPFRVCSNHNKNITNVATALKVIIVAEKPRTLHTNIDLRHSEKNKKVILSTDCILIFYNRPVNESTCNK